MRNLVLFVGICAFAKGQLVYELAEKQLKSQLQVRNGNDMACDVGDLDPVNELTQCEKIDGNLVPHGVRCMTYSSTLDLSSVARCSDGQWIPGETSSVGHHRSKRSFLIAAAIAVIVITGVVVCIVFCGGTKTKTVNVVRKAPSYGNTCPPADIQPVYNASEGTREAVVTWTAPVAKDEDGHIKSNSQKTTPLNGKRFKGSVHGWQHTVIYEAKDDDGMSAFCTFSFTVNVRYCAEIQGISHGYKLCTEGNIYGSVCTVYCDKGYEISGDATAKCKMDGSWSVTPSCSKKQCDKPDEPLNGAVTCRNSENEYLSICFVRCNKGFESEGSVVMQCQADQTWSMAGVPTNSSRCVDVEPPTIECLTPQIFYADRGLSIASSVNWEEPRAYDTVDENPVVNQTGGPQQFATLAEESTYVSYRATDSAGNISPECSIELRIEPITCGHPADTLTDTKLIFNCSDSLYQYGVTCDLTCDLNLPLDGAEMVTCEANTSDEDPVGQWVWGSGAKPVCRVVTCPPLVPPINGAFLQDTVDSRPEVRMFCNENYDIPEWDGFDGVLQCYDSLQWRPFSELPNCIQLHSNRIMNLPSKLYYYSGECSDPDTLEQIKQQFITIIMEATTSRFHSLCTPDLLNCSIDSVNITCGPTTRRKRDLLPNSHNQNEKLTETYPARRKKEVSDTPHHINKREESHVTTLLFNLVTEWDQSNLGNMTYNEQLAHIDEFQNDQKDVIADLLVEGILDIEGYMLKNDSFHTEDYGIDACAHGMIKDGSKCKPCPRGRYFAGGEQCTECPIGQYRDTDSAVECEKCPEGMTTEKTGSVSRDNCTKICGPGSYSKKGLAPCSLCPVGKYQNSDGRSSCDPCPSGQTTAIKGSTTQTACQGFDALLRTTTQDVSIGTIPAIENLSIMFWAKLFSVGTMPTTSLKVKDESGAVLMTINIAPEISVQVGDSLLEAAVILSDAKWDHIGVVWNRDMSSVQVFINGELKDDQTVSLPSLTNGSVAVHSNASEGVYLTGLVVVDKILKEEDIQLLLASCTETMDSTILSMDSFLGKSSNAIKIITPAICDAIDDCATSPCGDHLCINKIGNFSCICSQGMTGRLCDIPRDYCIGNECKHGATCNNQEDGYTCSCLEGYSGSFCEISPVKGNWSEYGEWSSCTVSCDKGTRSRSRTCDNPPPGLGGQPCSGPDHETEDCNLRPCKECLNAPPRCDGIFPNCSTNPTSGIRQCFPYCRNGTFMQPAGNQYETYTCGHNTDYEWTPFKWCPRCVDEDQVDRPIKYRLDTSMEYETKVPSSSVTDVKTKIESELSSRTDCVNKGLCQYAVSLDESGSRRKRDTGSFLQLTFDVVLGDSGDLKIDEYVDSGMVSPGLQELIDAIVSLELTAADLQANASNYFNVDSGGMTYTINDTSLTLDGIIDCPVGSVSDDGVCVACPVGTKVDSNACVYCDVGSYQDETGQTVCKQCPNGFSTPIIGASDVSDCTVSGSVTSTTATPSTTARSTDSITQPDESEDEDENNKKPNKTGIIAGIAIGSFAFFLAAIALFLVCYYKHARNNRRQNQRGSFASLNMVGQRNSRSASNSRSMQTDHTNVTAMNPLPLVFPTRAGADALMKEKQFGELDDLTAQFTALPPRTTCFTPPPPYTENP